MKLLPYFDVYLIHPYYADGRCLDFYIEPTRHTQRLMRNHRCVLEQRPNGVSIQATVTDQRTLLIPVPQEASFTFNLYLQNSDFERFTDLTATTETRLPLYTNADLGLGQERQLSLTSRSHASRSATKAFAEVDICHNNSMTPIADGPCTFHITFTAKTARWVYYVVTDLNLSGDAIQIVDGDTTPLIFSDKNRRDLNQVPASVDAVAQTLASQYPNLKRFRFVSDGWVPCRQTARKQLHLYLDGTRVAGALPNPSIRHAATIVVDPDETAAPQEVLFQVVKYISYPFPSAGG